jgi:hypothetical protein
LPTEPPSLAARLDQERPLPWREAARLTARVARALDRLHAQGRVHGDVEPLTVLFVGGTVRLADPLPPGDRQAVLVPPWVGAGAEPDRPADFFALGRTMAAMLAGEAHAAATPAELPPPLAAVLQRMTAADGKAAYGSGNDIAAALELAIAASEGLAVEPPPVAAPPPAAFATGPATGPAPEARRGPAPAAASPARRRRQQPVMLLLLLALLGLAGLAVYWLQPAADVAIEPPPADLEPPTVAAGPAPDAADGTAPPAEEPAPAEPPSLEEVLAALPEAPLAEPPARPEAKAELRALMAGLHERPCTRLEVEPSPLGLRLVGSTASATDRTELLAALAAIADIDRVTLGLDQDGRHCRLYDMLGRHTDSTLPRLADLFPSRDDYRLAAAEPLIVRVLTPDFPSHLSVDYFTADGMVVHLEMPQAADEPLPPVEELRIGDPADGQWLTIAEPFGEELILVIASRERLFEEPRPRIEPADGYLDALEAALAVRAERPMASTMAIRTVPAGP